MKFSRNLLKRKKQKNYLQFKCGMIESLEISGIHAKYQRDRRFDRPRGYFGVPRGGRKVVLATMYGNIEVVDLVVVLVDFSGKAVDVGMECPRGIHKNTWRDCKREGERRRRKRRDAVEARRKGEEEISKRHTSKAIAFLGKREE
jgi:hypothetical protein